MVSTFDWGCDTPHEADVGSYEITEWMFPIQGDSAIGKEDKTCSLLKIMQIGLPGEMTFAGSRYRDFSLVHHSSCRIKAFKSPCISVATRIGSLTGRLAKVAKVAKPTRAAVRFGRLGRMSEPMVQAVNQVDSRRHLQDVRCHWRK